MGSMNEARTARRYAQRICAVLLALAIALWSMALPLGSITQALAADDDTTTYTITINNATAGTYSAYQILTGTYTSSGALGGDAAVNSSIQSALLAALTATESTTGEYTITINESADSSTYSSGKSITFYDYDNLDSDGKASSTTVDYTDYALAYAVMCQLEEIDSDGLEATFANNLAAQVSSNSVSATATATVYASDTTASISVSATGYYLVTQTGSSTTNTSPILLDVTDEGGIADQKSATEPTATKTVTTDTTTGAAITYNSDGTASITYSIEGTVASDIDDYSTYSYSFVDTLPAGITIGTSGSSIKTDSVYIGSTNATSSFTMTSSGTADSDGVTTTTVTWSCTDILSVSGASVTSDTKITLTYTLTICADELSVITSASTSDTGALVNTAYVTYSNDPNGSGTGSSSESTTEADINLYNLVVYKVDDESSALSGATFSLTASNGYSQTATETTVYDTDGSTVTAYTFTFTALELGVTYTLSETTVPSGYKQIQDVTFSLSETTQTSSDGSSTVTLPSATKTSDLSQCATFVTDSNDDNTVTVTIVNNPGNTLPTTGLSGRTLALLAGLLLIVVCAGLLLTRRRKATAQQ